MHLLAMTLRRTQRVKRNQMKPLKSLLRRVRNQSRRMKTLHHQQTMPQKKMTVEAMVLILNHQIM